MLRLNHLIAETRTVRDEYLELLLTLLLLLTEHLLVCVKTCLTLCLTCLRSHVCPLKLAFESLTALGSLLLLLHHALGLLVEP